MYISDWEHRDSICIWYFIFLAWHSPFFFYLINFFCSSSFTSFFVFIVLRAKTHDLYSHDMEKGQNPLLKCVGANACCSQQYHNWWICYFEIVSLASSISAWNGEMCESENEITIANGVCIPVNSHMAFKNYYLHIWCVSSGVLFACAWWCKCVCENHNKYKCYQIISIPTGMIKCVIRIAGLVRCKCPGSSVRSTDNNKITTVVTEQRRWKRILSTKNKFEIIEDGQWCLLRSDYCIPYPIQPKIEPVYFREIFIKSHWNFFISTSSLRQKA